MGHRFSSQTDSKVICHVLEDDLPAQRRHETAREQLVQALMRVFRRLEGLNAIVVLDRSNRCMAAVKAGSPLVLGSGQYGNFVASDSSTRVE